MPIINKTISIELTKAEVEEILKQHFKDVLIDPKIGFHLREEGGDVLDRFPGVKVLYKVTVEGKHK
jgi:hypothetical protein